MKKLLFGIMLFIAIFSLSATPAEASSESFDVTFTARFDEQNIGTPIVIDNQSFASRVGLAGNVSAIENYDFAFWIVNGVVRFDLAVDHEFVVSRDMDIEAIFSQGNQHAVVFMDANGKQIDVQYVLDGEDAIDITEGLPSKPDFKVSTTEKWSGSLEGIFEDTILVLQYEIDTSAEFTLTNVNEGTTEDILYNEVVTLQANPGEEEYFQYWKRDGFIVSYDSTYRFTMMTDTTVEAVYGEAPVVAEPVMYLSEPLTLRDGHVSYVVQFYIPEGYELIDFGILSIDGIYQGFEIDTTLNDHDIIQTHVDKFYGPTNEYLVSFPNDEVLSARGYMVVENNDIEIIYSSTLEPKIVLINPDGTGFGLNTLQVRSNGGFEQAFSLYYNGIYIDSTLSGELGGLPNVYKENPHLMVVKIDGVYYPVEVE